MRREEYILAHIKKTGRGLEVGPSHNPIAPKRSGFQTHVIDHMSKDKLKLKYKDHDVNLDLIEDVDFIWNGEPYSTLTGYRNYYDWVIASHVIEHVPDFIGFLVSCDEVLRDDGVISLAVPDCRFCFDHFRPISALGSVIDAYAQKRTRNSIGTVADFLINATKRDGKITWPRNASGMFQFIHGLPLVRATMERVERGEYVDSHVWCFTPHWFRLLVEDLFTLGFIPLREIAFADSGTHEFYVTVGRSGHGPGMSRLELLKIVSTELAEADAGTN